jgi:hypothetical protein
MRSIFVFVANTYCGSKVAEALPKRSARSNKLGSPTSRNFILELGAAVCLVVFHDAYAQTDTPHKALVEGIHADLTSVRNFIFDIEHVEKWNGVRLELCEQGSITKEGIFRPLGTLRAPYSSIEYELRSRGAWAGLTLSVDRKHCISPSDLNDFFPMGEGVPETSDHFPSDDFVIGFGDDHNRVWIIYQREKGTDPFCARQFRIEATK